MFNPLAPLSKKALAAFVADGNCFFVRQTFERARHPFEEGIKGYYLFCHYQVYAQAKEHFDALQGDPGRFLYDWDNEQHRRMLEHAATQPPGYKLFTNTFMPDWERHITRRMRQKIRRYLHSKGWNPARDEGVLIDFYPHFGEVMITLRFRHHQVSVKLQEIENQY